MVPSSSVFCTAGCGFVRSPLKTNICAINIMFVLCVSVTMTCIIISYVFTKKKEGKVFHQLSVPIVHALLSFGDSGLMTLCKMSSNVFLNIICNIFLIPAIE